MEKTLVQPKTQPQTPTPTSNIIKGEMVKKKRQPSQMKVVDLVSDILIGYLEKSIRATLPEGGIHKPFLWKTKAKWGCGYRVMANVPFARLSKMKSPKYIIFQVKWINKHGNLCPDSGFEFAANNIERYEGMALRKELDKIN